MSALHQPCVGDEVADPWEAVDVVDFVEDHQGEDFPDTGDSAKQVNGYGIMVGNVRVDLSFEREDLCVKGLHECGIHLDGGTDHGVGEPVFDTAAIGTVRADGKGTTGGEGDPVSSALPWGYV